MVGGRSSTAKHLHFKTKTKRRFPVRRFAVVAVIVVILAGAAAVRAATESLPALTVRRVVPASVTLPGGRPALAWPAQGEAAVAVDGLPLLGSSGPETPVPIASLAKIMTAYVLLEDHPVVNGQPGFDLTVSPADVAAYQTAASQQQSVVPVAQGESLSEVQLLQALLVASGNNIATTVANYDAGSTAGFVAKMNTAAKNLGMDHTSYTDPSGLASSTISTATDQLLLAGRAMAIPAFAQTVAMPSVKIPVAGSVANFNKAVGTGGFIGVKTGSTAKAGGCLVFANRQSIGARSITILGAVLGQDLGQTSTSVLTGAALNAASALVGSVLSSVSSRTVLAAGTVVAVVTNGSGVKANATTSAALTTLGFGGLTVEITLRELRLGTRLSAGQTIASVGVAGLGAAGTGVTGPSDTAPVTVASGTPSPGWSWRLSHLF